MKKIQPAFVRAAQVASVVLTLTAAPSALAYVGPGAGLGLLAALAAVVGAVLLTVVGLFLWPIRALKRRRQARTDDEDKNKNKKD